MVQQFNRESMARAGKTAAELGREAAAEAEEKALVEGMGVDQLFDALFDRNDRLT